MKKDNIYKKLKDGPFQFNEDVAIVFPDMLERSIPGYKATIKTIKKLASSHVKSNTNCYDLGCSLGAATIAMRHGINKKGCKIVAVDKAEAMMNHCKKIILEDSQQYLSSTSINVVHDDICNTQIKNASMVVLNFTLQFIEKNKRNSLLKSIYNGLNKDGLLVLSEKIIDEDQITEKLLVDLHHDHKRQEGYSEIEITRKKAALKNILIPETIYEHQERLKKAGFNHSIVWLRYFNFMSIIAIKNE
ncbi:MAG: carboxy-S-adenosyl-L-methionine synthase CmoA [Gammaproteobacteria bacterium]|nr:carboxy-S-adenosyl-L-methionine synthase CmoA [Gammaproteobacteria bacterium]|tara:strand:+ start:721 stop:1458 length:738 start_codon:yes stop_codon:yes gene_type:complete